VVKKILRGFNFLPTHIIAVSRAGMKRNKALFGKKNQYLIVNGIDLKRFPHNKPPINKVTTGCYVGRIDEKKGIWRLIDSINYIVHTLKRTNFLFDIVGGNSEQKKQLNEYVTRLDLNSNVNVLGYQTDPSITIKNCHFVVIPTLIEEAISLAALEARSTGRPILYSNKGGLPETMIPNKTGIVMNDLSVEGIAESFEKMLDSPMTNSGVTRLHNRFFSYFDHHRMFSEYQIFYNKIFQKMN